MTEEAGIIIEYITLGNSMKVTALDPHTLSEVSVVVPPSTERKEAAALAIRKLRYMMTQGKKNNE
jgi:hypothetical protein